MTNQTLNVHIVSPKQIIYQGAVLSISSTNSAGSFDILPQHANFVTLIENSPIVVRVPNQKPLVFKFPLAIIVNRENKVDIYTYVDPF